jgi:hypothetical protein
MMAVFVLFLACQDPLDPPVPVAEIDVEDDNSVPKAAPSTTPPPDELGPGSFFLAGALGAAAGTGCVIGGLCAAASVVGFLGPPLAVVMATATIVVAPVLSGWLTATVLDDEDAWRLGVGGGVGFATGLLMTVATLLALTAYISLRTGFVTAADTFIVFGLGAVALTFAPVGAVLGAGGTGIVTVAWSSDATPPPGPLAEQARPQAY